MRQSRKIKELRKNDTPINYSTLSVNEMGSLQSRAKLLDDRVVEGYGVIWGSINQHEERFVKGAFAKSISDSGPESNSTYKIKFVDRHGKACSLFAVLREDEIGLYFRTMPLDNVQWANDLLTQIRSGTINNFSVCFKHVWDKAEWDDENDCLVILEARLFEISGVDIPSDLATYAIRNLEEIEYLRDDVEDFIISLPKSKQIEARKIFTRCMTLSEQEPQEQMRNALRDSKKQSKSGLDFDYLIDKL